MSPLFQLVYSTAYSLDESLFQLVYSTAYSLDDIESLIPTGFIQLFIPMAALIWSHFLFNNFNIQLLIPWMSPLFQLVYSTAYSLDESLIPTGFIQLFIPMAALIWSHFLFNFLFLFNLNGRPYLVTLILFLFFILFYFILFYSFFFFFFFGKKGALGGIRTWDLLISSLDAYR